MREGNDAFRLWGIHRKILVSEGKFKNSLNILAYILDFYFTLLYIFTSNINRRSSSEEEGNNTHGSEKYV